VCGSENWALNISERRKIETVDMRFLKCVSGLEVDHDNDDEYYPS
jgi:hypothetical protein